MNNFTNKLIHSIFRSNNIPQMFVFLTLHGKFISFNTRICRELSLHSIINTSFIRYFNSYLYYILKNICLRRSYCFS